MDLYMLLYRTFHAQRKQLRPYMAQLGLSPGQPKILMYVSNHEGCMQKEAAESCDIEPATISRMIDTLEKGGFVKRVIPKNNRRAGNLYLTEKGEESYQLWKAHCLEVEQGNADRLFRTGKGAGNRISEPDLQKSKRL